ncbi:type I restriction endonuclease EcoAI subunit S [Comamonas aquatica DA1877]|uniref:Type I restriction endonuclease EcoAI subunit S n=1 Tax=Comamonas aquatica DA1877 TaxID=1457173 RepID=A0A014NHW5_9BURK|nr:restriction endonuclease subunit S [Comamonas aquatica]EXU79023.1 type I restriction endonuclease EcoAI subunit S [Comamonas aquatica DA1877]
MLLSNLELLATAPGGVAKLRELILTLAVQGKLVPQDPGDEPASVLLQKIRAEKDRLIAEGTIKKDKPLAAIADEEKPFALPMGWEWVRLGDICAYIQRGKGPVYAESSKHRVVSQKCVRWHGLDLAPARFVTPESLAKYEPIRFLQAGDLLWNSTGTGTIGRACLVPVEHDNAGLVADSHVTVVRPVLISSWFVWRWIQSPYVQSEIEGSASGTTNQIELNTSTVVNHLVPLPPLVEQSRIVARVEELMRLCDALEAKGQLEATQHAQLLSTLLGTLTASATPEELTNNWQRVAQHFDLLLDRPEAIDALEQTLLQLAVRGLLVPQDPADEPASVLLQKIRAEKDRLIAAGQIKKDKPLPPVTDEEKPFELPVGWEWVRMGSLGESFDYGSSQKSVDDSNAVPILRMGNIQGGQVVMSNLKYLKDLQGELPYLFLRKGDLLFNRTNSYELVGKTGLFGGYPREVTFASYLIRIRLMNDLVNSEYMNVYMNTRDCRVNEIEPDLTQQTGQANYNGTKLKNIRVALPPLAEQSSIVTRVTQLRRLCADLRQRLAEREVVQARLAEALVQQVA